MTEKWCTYTPVCEQYVRVLWNQGVQTDIEVEENRPDIIIKNKREKTCTLMDEAVPADGSFMQKERIGN